MRIAIVGGTGKLGSGLAIRWARAGNEVVLGSRQADKARLHAATLVTGGHGFIEGDDQVRATKSADIVVLTVPYAAHQATVRAIAAAAKGKVVIDATVPLRPPNVDRVQLPPGRAAALEAQAMLGPETPVAAALHHVSAAHLADPAHPIESDVLVAVDDPRARKAAFELLRDLGVRPLDAGPLVNAIALESMTPVLIHLNRTYKSRGAGVVFTNLPLRDSVAGG